MIVVKRVYEPASTRDGTRLLVERLWPRGRSKATVKVRAWSKEAAPSTELRKWFNHDPAKWDAFLRRYFRELDGRPEAWKPIVAAARRGRVTLIYSSHDAQYNNAVALQQYLRHRSRASASSRQVAEVGRTKRSGR